MGDHRTSGSPSADHARLRLSQPQERQLQIARMTVFLNRAIPLIGSFGILEGLAFFYLLDSRSGATGLVIGGYVAVLIAARNYLIRGALHTAVTLTWSGVLSAAAIIVLIQPELFATLALIPLLAIAVALPYLQGRGLRRLSAVCWLAMLGIAMVGEIAKPAVSLPTWFSGFLHISSLAAAAALILLLLSQFSSWLTETLQQTQAANSALRESEARYRTIVEEASDAIFTCDMQGTLLEVNPKMCELLGYQPGQLIGRNLIDDFFDPAEVLEHSLLADALPQGDAILGERRLRHRDQSYRTVESSMKRLEDGRLLGIARDITARKWAEEELRESEERYRVVAETAGDAIVTIDQESQILFANPAVERIFGYSLDEIIGQHITMLMPAHLRHAHTRAISNYLTSGKRQFVWEGIMLPGLHKSQREIPLEVSFGEFQQHGQRRFTGIIRDISERKRAEEQRMALERTLLEGQKLESLAVLAGGIAHDFNNLLSVIIGNAELSMSDLADNAPMQDSMNSILNAAHRAAGLTQQMLSYSGKGNFLVQHIDLNTLLADMHDMLQNLIFGEVDLTFRLSSESLLIEGDVAQMRQLIINLLTNAAESITGHSGQITLTTCVRHVSRADFAQAYLAPDLPEGQYAVLEISDTGRGIAEETLARIFEPFFTTKFVGRGLGLPAVLGIVRAHQGALRVESCVNQGSTFTVLLPFVCCTIL